MSAPVQRDWRDEIQRGDVLRAGSGTERVVREVRYWETKHGTPMVSVVFSILHCSWTGQCYTILSRSDLRTLGYQPTGRRVQLRKAVDRLISRALAARPGGESKGIATCCDVHGVA